MKMKIEIIKNEANTFPFYTVMLDNEEYCYADEIEQAENIVNLLSMHLSTKCFIIEVHNNRGSWYEIVLANSFLEAKNKAKKAYPYSFLISFICEYDKPII